ncbi:MAG: hypothetical protein QXM43_03235 [Desulfurococcaceae archaeon]
MRLNCADIEHYELAYRKLREFSLYEDGSIILGVVDNAVIVEHKPTHNIYIVYFENIEKALETAKTIIKLIQFDINIEKVIDKIAVIEKMVIEEIKRTFLIFKEKPFFDPTPLSQ